MRRRQLFEFEDFAWFPRGLRDHVTALIEVVHRLLGTDALITPLVRRALTAGGTDQIVDLCSGAGGPMYRVRERLGADGSPVRLTLTDLHPNAEAIAGIQARGEPSVVYRETPVDAAAVPTDLRGVRTMICSFHHMPEATARAILRDAFEQRQPFCLFEISDNAQPAALSLFALPLSVLMGLLLTPFVRPLTPSRLLQAYVVPLAPLAFAWDGVASNLRTYTLDDLRELIAGLEAPDYHWELGSLAKPGYPSRMPYLLGLPRENGAHAR
jgi:hypothetical protein